MGTLSHLLIKKVHYLGLHILNSSLCINLFIPRDSSFQQSSTSLPDLHMSNALDPCSLPEFFSSPAYSGDVVPSSSIAPVVSPDSSSPTGPSLSDPFSSNVVPSTNVAPSTICRYIPPGSSLDPIHKVSHSSVPQYSVPSVSVTACQTVSSSSLPSALPIFRNIHQLQTRSKSASIQALTISHDSSNDLVHSKSDSIFVALTSLHWTNAVHEEL